MTSAQMLLRLNDLIGEAGKNIYERASLISELLEDRNWIVSSFAGDDYRAAETLQDKYLHDLSGTVSIFELLTIFRKFPREADWKTEGYHIRKLLTKAKPKDNSPKTQRQSVKVSEYEAVLQSVVEKEHQVKVLEKTIREIKNERESAQKQMERLRLENERLKGRIEELESILNRKFTKVA